MRFRLSPKGVHELSLFAVCFSLNSKSSRWIRRFIIMTFESAQNGKGLVQQVSTRDTFTAHNFPLEILFDTRTGLKSAVVTLAIVCIRWTRNVFALIWFTQLIIWFRGLFALIDDWDSFWEVEISSTHFTFDMYTSVGYFRISLGNEPGCGLYSFIAWLVFRVFTVQWTDSFHSSSSRWMSTIFWSRWDHFIIHIWP